MEPEKNNNIKSRNCYIIELIKGNTELVKNDNIEPEMW